MFPASALKLAGDFGDARPDRLMEPVGGSERLIPLARHGVINPLMPAVSGLRFADFLGDVFFPGYWMIEARMICSRTVSSRIFFLHAGLYVSYVHKINSLSLRRPRRIRYAFSPPKRKYFPAAFLTPSSGSLTPGGPMR